VTSRFELRVVDKMHAERFVGDAEGLANPQNCQILSMRLQLASDPATMLVPAR
jgi:hypothetical protein